MTAAIDDATRARGLALLEAGRSRAEVAERCGVSIKTVSRWRSARDAPTTDEDVDALVQGKLRRVVELDAAAQEALEAQRDAVANKDSKAAWNFGVAYGIAIDKGNLLEQQTVQLLERYKHVQRERVSYLAGALEVVICALFPTPEARAVAKRVLGGWLRSVERGEPKVGVREREALEDALAQWAYQRNFERVQRELERSIRTKLEAELREQLRAPEPEPEVVDADEVIEPAPPPLRAVPGMLQDEPDPFEDHPDDALQQVEIYRTDRPVAVAPPRWYHRDYLDSYGDSW